MLIDTHSHLNLSAFDNDREEVIKQCLKNNILVLNVGTNYENSKKAIEIAEKYNKGVYAAIGLHPEDILKEKFDYGKYKKLAESEKVVAIGEIGLDFWRRPKTKKKLEEFKNKQKDLLLQEIKLAQELNLPIILHCRNAFDDLFNTLKTISNNIATARTLPKGVIHCFTGTWEQAEKFLEMGFYIGFNGIIFKTIEGIDFEANIKKTPLDKILLETDCPFLTPPNFGEERNNPLGVKIIAEYIAKIKNISFEKLAEITFENAKQLFKI